MSSTDTKAPVLKVAKRDEKGSRAVSAMRDAGRIPAQVYGHKKGNTELSMDTHEFEMLMRDKPSYMVLEGDGVSENVIVKDMQYAQFNLGILHVDFQRVSPEEPVDVNVAIEIFGTPAGADQGGRLEVRNNTVRLRVRADSIPNTIALNVLPLNVGDTVEFKDLTLPEGAELLSRPHGVVCACTISRRALKAAREREEGAAKGKGKK